MNYRYKMEVKKDGVVEVQKESLCAYRLDATIKMVKDNEMNFASRSNSDAELITESISHKWKQNGSTYEVTYVVEDISEQ
nr:MAG TPA: hypothetical protein [Caudoviricetes sp.]